VASAASLQERITEQAVTARTHPEIELSPDESDAVIRAVLQEMSAVEGCTYLASSVLFQDFSVRCRMRGLKNHGMDAVRFRRSFSRALAGLDEDRNDEQVTRLLEIAETVPEDLVTIFLALGKAVIAGDPCPDDETLAVLYGTRSVSRARRMLEHLERSDIVVVRTDFTGRRSVAIPQLSLAAPVV
jgi:hypothetical protein